jgi:polyhydroxyalkanoate synthesis regulator phasin
VISTLEEAKMRINELEKENEELKAEIERLKARNLGGRKRHNEAWMASYQEFAIKYEAGMTIMEIVKEGQISRRTAYRYKAYYDEMINQVQETDVLDKGCTYD